MGRQRRQSTKTDDPDRALREKLKFLDQQKQKPEEIEARTENLGKLPLNKAADLYSAGSRRRTPRQRFSGSDHHQTILGFSVLNSSKRVVELLPPQLDH
jgi:hypothetical protein